MSTTWNLCLPGEIIQSIFEMDRTRTDVWDNVMHQLRFKNLFREFFYRMLILCSFHPDNDRYRQQFTSLHDPIHAWIFTGRFFFFWYSPKNRNGIYRKTLSMAEQHFEEHVRDVKEEGGCFSSSHPQIIQRFYSQAWERLVDHHHRHYHL